MMIDHTAEWETVISAAIAKVESEELARRDAFIAIARDVPDPAEYARYLPSCFVDALLSAYPSGGCWRVYNHFAEREIRLAGLVEFGGPFLTAFGLAVRRELRAEAE